MSTSSKNHHFVPQSILRNFSINGKERQIFVFDKQSYNKFPSSIEKAGSENNFNTIELGPSKINFEDAFKKIDDLTPVILRKIINSETLEILNNEELLKLSFIATVQFLRTKLQRTSSIDFLEQLKNRLVESEININGIENFESLSNEDAKLISLGHLSKIQNYVQYFTTKDLLLLKAVEHTDFWISDNPVVLHNTFPYGEIGLNAKGIEIYFPISSKFCLAFYCPSILLKLEKMFVRAEAEIDSDDNWLKQLYFGIKNRKSVPAKLSSVNFINELQIHSSSRFIYSKTDDFSFAEKVLNNNSLLRNVKSLYSLGKISAPPMKPNLPAGEYLVVYGNRDHHILPIKDLSDELDFSGIKFLALDIDKLKQIVEDSPLEEFRVYVNGQQIRHMREAIFEEVSFDKNIPITIKHKIEGLNKILKK